MELSNKDKVENVILAVMVIPKNDRLFEYYINGMEDKRVMLQRHMMKFCVDLCPSHAGEIRKAIFEITPFIIYPEDKEFKVIKAKDPPPINRKALLFPMARLVKEDKIDLSKNNEDNVNKIAKNFSIWENYGIYIEQEKKRSTKDTFKLAK